MSDFFNFGDAFIKDRLMKSLSRLGLYKDFRTDIDDAVRYFIQNMHQADGKPDSMYVSPEQFKGLIDLTKDS